jgi:hypothetical protein
MSNPTFTTAATGTPPPDPSKHLNYTQGMVLGVDDFQQEFAYLSNRDQWLARDAIGYGTVCGLHVSIDPANNTRLSVSPGVAINPRGQLIRVAPEQCAKLDSWLALPDTVKQLQALGIGGTTEFSAYVVLCYRDCPADDLPVPGEPCRCDSTTKAPSRIIDDFRLELRLERPLQLEEDVVRRLVEWLRLIPVVEDFDCPGDLNAFLQAIKDVFLTGAGSPPEAPSLFFPDSPPSGLCIPHSQFCEWMRAAMRLWVTELRPIWQVQCAPKSQCACGGPCGCHGTGGPLHGSECECLLLAEVVITRSGGGITGVTVDERERPFVVHLRMLQELLLCGPCCGEMGEASSPPSSPAGSSLAPATTVVAENAFAANAKSPRAGTSLNYAREDHTHGVPPDPIPPHVLNTSVHLPHQIKGDVTGTLGATVVSRLQGVPVSATAPQKDQVLQFDLPTKTWVPKNPAGGPAGNFVEHPNVGRYLIVAAGWFRVPAARGQNLLPFGETYNKLSGKRFLTSPPQQSTFILTFGGNAGSAMDRYIRPTDTFIYIVKGTTYGNLPGFFHVLEFARDGIVIQVASMEGKAVEAFMVEISLFGPF